MKRLLTLCSLTLAVFAAPFTHAEFTTWTDPKTGIEWAYQAQDLDGDKTARLVARYTSFGDYGDEPSISPKVVGAITIPTLVDGYRVTSIEWRALKGCSLLTSVTIPEGVTNIASEAFSSCTSLTAINIPESVTTIGGAAFFNCRKLSSVVLPKGAKDIEGEMFSGCSSLASIVLPEGVPSIDSGFFKDCSSLTSVTLPASITKIDRDAFRGCSKLTSLTIPAGVKELGEDTFTGCDSLKNLTFLGDCPAMFPVCGLSGVRIDFPREFGGNWVTALEGAGCVRGTYVELLPKATAEVAVRKVDNDEKTIEVAYTVASAQEKVTVRAVAFKDGVRSLANAVPMTATTGKLYEAEVAPGTEQSFTWNVAANLEAKLVRVAVDILMKENLLLPQELITIPEVKGKEGFADSAEKTITRNPITPEMAFEALLWCFAGGDAGLKVENGVATIDGVKVAEGSSVVTSGAGATKLLTYLYGKLGHQVLAGEALTFAQGATRLPLSGSGLNQVSEKVESATPAQE